MALADSDREAWSRHVDPGDDQALDAQKSERYLEAFGRDGTKVERHLGGGISVTPVV